MEKHSALDSFRFAKLIPFVHIKGDSPTTAVLWVLCAMARGKTNKDYEAGTCDPSIPYIAIRTQLSISTVKRSLKKLAEAGLISARVRGTSDHHLSSLYKLDYDKLLAVLRTCKDADEEYVQAVRDEWSATKRRKRGACPAQGEPDKGIDVRVKSEERLAQIAHPSSSELADVRVKSEECPAQCDTLTTYNCDLTTGTTKELKGEHISGIRDSESRKTVAPEDIQELERKCLDLKALQDKAVSEGLPKEYSSITSQLQEAQARLNTARGQLFRAEMAEFRHMTKSNKLETTATQ